MKATDFYDIYGYEFTPFWQTGLFIIGISIVGTLVLAFCVGFLIRYIRHRRNRLSVLLSHEWAEIALEKLIKNLPETKEGYKLFYFTLSEIIKEYIFLRFTWQVQNKTDEELLSFLKKQNSFFDKKLLEDLKEIFGGALEVKFADAQTLKKQVEKDSILFKNFVQKTIAHDQ